MAKPVIQRPQADADIDVIINWLARKSPHAARDFLEAIEQAYAILAQHPRIGSTRHAKYCPELHCPLRFHVVNRFPRILIYYIEHPKAVEVIRVWDAARGLEALVETMRGSENNKNL